MTPPDPRLDEIHYPETDGKPMESDLHRDLMVESIAALSHRYRHDPQVYISGNLFVYYVEGHPEYSFSPDVFVVRGVPKRQRPIYKTWEEKMPEFALELTSRSTHRQDLGRKRDLYEELGVLEYFLFDPEGIRFRPQLRGFRRREGVLEAIEAARREDGTMVLQSEVLGLELHARGNTLRWVDPETGRPLPIPEELYQQIEEAQALAEAERERAEAERERADAERGRADKEKARADALAEEVARLRMEKEDHRAQERDRRSPHNP